MTPPPAPKPVRHLAIVTVTFDLDALAKLWGGRREVTTEEVMDIVKEALDVGGGPFDDTYKISAVAKTVDG